MMDAFTEDEKVCLSKIPSSDTLCLVAPSNVTSQRFVLAEYIKASQVGTEQLIDFISEPGAVDNCIPWCAV